MIKDKTLGLLGLATRARKVVLGEDLVIKTLAASPNSIVFLASDAGDNIKKKIRNKTITYNSILIDAFTTDELSAAIGKNNRKIVLVTDKGFIKKFKELINS